MSPDQATTDRPRVPYDVEQAAALLALSEMLPPSITPDMIQMMRGAPIVETIEAVLASRDVIREDRTVPGPQGEPDITLSIFRRADHRTGSAAVYHTHGGGMIIGDRFVGVAEFLDWVDRFDIVFITVEYRLAPEHPDPAPVEDCYAGLVWTAAHAEELGFDPDRLVIAGGSAGGGLAAGTALLARDRSGPALAGQLLIYPMIDDRNTTISSHQYVGIGVWDRTSNDTGWDALLGDRRGTGAVSIYAAPSRATDLSGLPPAFISVGSAEVFRDEDVAYASALWADGVQAELHVWPGSFHGADMMAPQSALSQAALAARLAWFTRLIGA